MERLPTTGDLVLGKYRIVGELGRGGMGIVFAAENVATNGPVALKLLRPGSKPDLLARMAREGRAAARLRSRFVARVLDLDHTDDGSPVLVMERLEGRDLAVEMRGRGQLPVDEAVSYIVQACAGVAEAHENGIIHRDIKPGNLFLETTSAASPTVRVLDFGLAKILESSAKDITSPSDIFGTPAYMAPEQFTTPRNVGSSSDVWALGIVLFRMLCARLPIDGHGMEIAARLIDTTPLPRIDRADVPVELVDVVMHALEKTRAKRYADARAFGQALHRFVVRPSPMTKLAIEDLNAGPSSRVSRASKADGAPRKASLPPIAPPPKRAPERTPASERLCDADTLKVVLRADAKTVDNPPSGTIAVPGLVPQDDPAAIKKTTPSVITPSVIVNLPPSPREYARSSLKATQLVAPRRGWDRTSVRQRLERLPLEARVAIALTMLGSAMLAVSLTRGSSKGAAPASLVSAPPVQASPDISPTLSPTVFAEPSPVVVALPDEAPPVRTGGYGAPGSRHPIPVSGSKQNNLELARGAALRNDPMTVRRYLEPLVRSGAATPEEALLLKNACRQMGDKACVEDIKAKYPLQ